MVLPMKKYCIYILLSVLIVGCAQIPDQASLGNADWQNHQQQLEKLTHWSLSGKVAIITAQKRHSLNIHWQQSGANYHIILTNFLGSTILDVQKTPLGTQVTDAKGKVYFGSDTQQLITQLSGMDLPVDVLQQWIKGNPSEALYQLDDKNLLLSLQGQDNDNANWSIEYKNYKTIQQINLPHQLQLKGEDLRLKFAISRWQIDQRNL
jgi:outer membrane lipoprotein LolB